MTSRLAHFCNYGPDNRSALARELAWRLPRTSRGFPSKGIWLRGPGLPFVARGGFYFAGSLLLTEFTVVCGTRRAARVRGVISPLCMEDIDGRGRHRYTGR